MITALDTTTLELNSNLIAIPVILHNPFCSYSYILPIKLMNEKCNTIALSVRCQLQVILTARRWRQEPPRVLFFSESMFT